MLSRLWLGYGKMFLEIVIWYRKVLICVFRFKNSNSILHNPVEQNKFFFIFIVDHHRKKEMYVKYIFLFAARIQIFIIVYIFMKYYFFCKTDWCNDNIFQLIQHILFVEENVYIWVGQKLEVLFYTEFVCFILM